MPGDVTQILSAYDSGDPKAAEELLPLVYEELRKMAASKMANERPGQTLQATALVHEAWLRLAGSDQRQWRGRSHFFGAAAEAMRRVLIDKARQKASLKLGQDQPVYSNDLPIVLYSASYSPTGSQLAIASNDGKTYLIDLPNEAK